MFFHSPELDYQRNFTTLYTESKIENQNLDFRVWSGRLIIDLKKYSLGFLLFEHFQV